VRSVSPGTMLGRYKTVTAQAPVRVGGEARPSYEDVFTKIEMCRRHYTEVGLGAGYVDQFVR
jgi:hypothetical protein